MEQISATSSAADYAARSQEPRGRLIARAEPPKAQQDGPAAPEVTDNGHLRAAQAQKSAEHRHREADQQVTQQRAQDMARGTMFDLRA